jgi:type VI secretion system secreted protein Hcp
MAQDMFLEIKGVAGESKDKVHKGKIDVLAFSIGVSQSASFHMGGGGGGGKCNVQDMSITKPVDKSSPELFLRCCTGKHFDEATLTIRKAGDTPLEYEIYKMTKVIIANVSKGASAQSDGLTEQISLNFAKLYYKYTEQSATGGVESAPDMTFDIAENASA